MKKLFTLIAFSFTAFAAQAQTAPDFTAKDCSGTSHNLYTDLASGKVVIINWVMPCSACVDASSHCSGALKNYAQSANVIHYLLDDMGDQDCSYITNWATSSGVDMSKVVILDNKNNVVNEANYTGTGMPHIMVVGGPNHKVYFNGKNAAADDTAAIKNAITSAFSDLGVGTVNKKLNFSLTPNPAKDKLSVTYSQPIRNISVLTLSGQLVKEEAFGNVINPSINISGIPAGIYMVNITDKDGHIGVQKIVKE